MKIITGDGTIKHNLTRNQVIGELQAAKATGDKFCSVWGAYERGLDPFELQKEAGYSGADETQDQEPRG